jgi:cobalt-zinc-cadmium efflux system outer membrane protein
MLPRRLLLACALLTSGCLWPVRENTDATVAKMAARAIDPQPQPVMPPATVGGGKLPKTGTTAAAVAALPAADVQTTALMQQDERGGFLGPEIPQTVPGAETPQIRFGRDMTREQIQRAVARLYPKLPPLDEPPRPQPGPDGKPYTLADLQRLASENSPALRQVASDVEAARGALIQAKTYANPTVGFQNDPNNNNTGSGVVGIFVDQVFRTLGKQKLGVAAAERDLRTAELNLRRARIDLATAVRNAYYGLLVADETMRVTQALAGYTDEVYELQRKLAQSGGIYATYEPAALRGQAYTIRLAYKQATAGYVYAWKQLVSAIGIRHLPLTEVAGRADRFVPRYEFDMVREQMLRRHTDILIAQNGIEKARYVLKLAQITPYPDVEVRYTVEKETALPPNGWYNTLQIGGPLPIWDRNKGNIIAAQAALERALEQPHTAEVTLVGNLATAFTAYKTNLDALIYYRRHVLPDLVRYYRGVYKRRHLDPLAAFGDLVTAQQMLTSNITTYLSTLGSFWTGAVQVAALLQTEDLFANGLAEELPEMPDLMHLPRWGCNHGTTAPPVPPVGPPACMLGTPVGPGAAFAGTQAEVSPRSGERGYGLAPQFPTAAPAEVVPAQLLPLPAQLPQSLPDVLSFEVRSTPEAAHR